MKSLIGFLSSLVLIASAISPASSSSVANKLIECIANNNINPSSFQTIFNPESSLFSLLLQSRVQNLRYINSTTKPLLILTPSDDTQIQSALLCSREQGIEIRARCGGHDYAGISYLSDKPYIVIDLFNLNEVQVDVKEETAWVQSGAQLGELYYAIARQSTHLAFPAGLCPTFGTLVRKYGLAADNVIDAYLMDARGRILNRKAMGEEVFWAIKGGGAGSFGIVLSWKVKWQRFAHDVHEDLFVRILLLNEVLLDKTQMFKAKFKAKTDFVTEPVPESAFEGIWKMMLEEDVPIVILEPLGGKMNKIPESYTPFPHRKGHLYNIQYLVKWDKNGKEEEERHLEWMKRLYDYMEPHVSKSPRAAYLNYRDLDIGMNSAGGKTSFSEASVWGQRYFRDNFKRLTEVKGMFDPENFFRNEQSIPLLHK
ncbi:unnamed protein product [Linum tenue]|uniref:FAD-binding PCMH-type domain-containing protein n=1 Tax=Linum tenue TaxID=586396 RepID=A0AAV0QL01_9ROSI|nr:unnamed protein product [Linum tenue]